MYQFPLSSSVHLLFIFSAGLSRTVFRLVNFSAFPTLHTARPALEQDLVAIVVADSGGMIGLANTYAAEHSLMMWAQPPFTHYSALMHKLEEGYSHSSRSRSSPCGSDSRRLADVWHSRWIPLASPSLYSPSYSLPRRS